MNRLLSKIGRTIQDTGKRILGNELAQEENVVFGEKIVTPGMPEILRKIAGEGIVLSPAIIRSLIRCAEHHAASRLHLIRQPSAATFPSRGRL